MRSGSKMRGRVHTHPPGRNERENSLYFYDKTNDLKYYIRINSIDLIAVCQTDNNWTCYSEVLPLTSPLASAGCAGTGQPANIKAQST
ncbi:hypothetical protein OJAV_G00025640 [Oryzias javanicus]|uniref:Uncharacterized protein n=1 Tax=Oryzias javanicus TaxID=123683 RepID=A0A3S2Q064_ORYJA|nr:hypothetical protein OJAV_G00025640 [Oryzias javanicus]